ncbi:MAG: AMP-binding protein [Myxococcota bacterium]|nr:AMP-binding protein [Myxococcota bacterium]
MATGENPHLARGHRFDPSARGGGTLVGSWAAGWTEYPERTCLVLGPEHTLSYGDLEAASRRAAGKLRAAGLDRGDRVILSAASSVHLVVAHVACLRAGLVVVPTNTAYRATELQHVVGDAKPRAAIIDDPERAEWIRGADERVLTLSPDLPLPDGPEIELDGAAPNDPALIGYTSGTTGQPKGAVLSQHNLASSIEALRLAWRWTSDDRLALSLPLFHMHGLGVGLHGTLHAGASAILLPRFEPDAVFDAISAHGATLFFGVPTMYHRLAESPRVGELSALRLCVSGSAPLPAELHTRFEELTDQKILERYGMTETAMLVSNPVDGQRRPGTVGLPLPGVEMRLRGDPAEIEVRGPNIFAGYWERPDANSEAFTADGFFRTGDLGALDEEGYLVISGRARELLISGGYNVYPREVEEALAEDPRILEAAVVGTPSPEWGDAITAYLVTANEEEISPEAVRKFLASRLAPYKHPRILFRVDALPRNALGKLQKHRLQGGRVLEKE